LAKGHDRFGVHPVAALVFGERRYVGASATDGRRDPQAALLIRSNGRFRSVAQRCSGSHDIKRNHSASNRSRYDVCRQLMPIHLTGRHLQPVTVPASFQLKDQGR
jgi:hypothetical protein